MLGLLEQSERDELIPHVAAFINGQPTSLVSVLPSFHVMRIENHSIPIEYAYRVVRYCEFSAWVEDPALIIRLLRHWDIYPNIASAITRLSGMAPLRFYNNNRVWDSFLLALNLPFLNRQETRRAIECFSFPLQPTTSPPGVRVLVVNGPEKSGKSYTFEYILYVNSVFAEPNFKIIYIDFKKQMVDSYGPTALIASLLDQANSEWTTEVEIPDLDVQQAARWFQQLARLLISQIRSVNERNYTSFNTMIVLDNFDDPKIPRETLELIHTLASVATGQISTDNDDLIRLILLGYSENISNYRNRVRNEQLAEINSGDISQYFQNYATYKGVTLDPALLSEMVSKVGLQNATTQFGNLDTIAAQALKIAHAVFETPSSN